MIVNPNRPGIPTTSGKQHRQPTNPPQHPDRLSYDDWRALDGPLLGWFTEATANLVGFGSGSATSVAAASAGGAHGIVYGAGLNPALETPLMAANLALVGAATANYGAIQRMGASIGPALGIAVAGAGTSLRLGLSVWAGLSSENRQEVFQTAQDWTDRVVPPGETKGWPNRLARGAAGEVVGAAAGGWVGFRQSFVGGRALGKEWVDTIQRALYDNMHPDSQ